MDTNREDRNAVLRQGSQQQQTDQFFTLNEVPLPSLGLAYESGPLSGAKTIEIRGMTASDEDVLLNRTLVRRGTVITELLKGCIIDKSIDVGTMLSGDRNAVMIAVRVTGYGADYVTTINCPKCESQQEFSTVLTDLAVNELDLTKLDQVAPNKNSFRFKLPITGKTIVFRFLTGSEEEKILQDLEAKKKKGIPTDSPVTSRLFNLVESVDDNEDRAMIYNFCRNMPARDSLALRSHIDDNEPSVDMTNDFTCGSCGHEEVVSVPLGIDFFWPNARVKRNRSA